MFPEATEDVGELYDMQADPWELRNLYADPQYQDVVEQLRRDILDWLVHTQDRNAAAKQSHANRRRLRPKPSL